MPFRNYWSEWIFFGFLVYLFIGIYEKMGQSFLNWGFLAVILINTLLILESYHISPQQSRFLFFLSLFVVTFYVLGKYFIDITGIWNLTWSYGLICIMATFDLSGSMVLAR